MKDESIFQGIKESKGVRFEYSGSDIWSVYKHKQNAWIFDRKIRADRESTLAELVEKLDALEMNEF